MGKLINRIPGSRLLKSSLPGSRSQQAFSKPCLVNLISKDTYLVFSIYASLVAAEILKQIWTRSLNVKVVT